MERQVAAICESAFLHMRNISCIRKFLLAESTKMLTHAFVMCRLENCNSLLYRLPNYLIHRLKLFQNCATRLILCGFKYDCITPLLRYYTGFRGAEDCFQILLLTFKSLNDLVPSYIHDLLETYTPSRNLRSSTSNLLVTPRSRLKF